MGQGSCKVEREQRETELYFRRINKRQPYQNLDNRGGPSYTQGTFGPRTDKIREENGSPHGPWYLIVIYKYPIT